MIPLSIVCNYKYVNLIQTVSEVRCVSFSDIEMLRIIDFLALDPKIVLALQQKKFKLEGLFLNQTLHSYLKGVPGGTQYFTGHSPPPPCEVNCAGF